MNTEQAPPTSMLVLHYSPRGAFACWEILPVTRRTNWTAYSVVLLVWTCIFSVRCKILDFLSVFMVFNDGLGVHVFILPVLESRSVSVFIPGKKYGEEADQQLSFPVQCSFWALADSSQRSGRTDSTTLGAAVSVFTTQCCKGIRKQYSCGELDFFGVLWVLLNSEVLFMT